MKTIAIKNYRSFSNFLFLTIRDGNLKPNVRARAYGFMRVHCDA